MLELELELKLFLPQSLTALLAESADRILRTRTTGDIGGYRCLGTHTIVGRDTSGQMPCAAIRRSAYILSPCLIIIR